MGLYSRYVLPRLVDLSCRTEAAMQQREKVIPLASGRVIEVGIGSGLNLALYDPGKVTEVIGVDPSAELLRMAAARTDDAGVVVELIDAAGESIPIADSSADTVVMTFTLCSVHDVGRVLEEIRRVLRPDGVLLFTEHGAAPDQSVRKWQDRLTPVWRHIAGNCHLNRDVIALLGESGFRLKWTQSAYLPGPRWGGFTTWGAAARNYSA